MPEGDTVYLTAHRLHAALAGKTLARTNFRVPRYATVDLSGGLVTTARAVGKHLFIDIEHRGAPTSLHSHLQMEGAWHVHRPGTRWRRPAHTARVVLQAAGAEAVGFDLAVVELLSDPDAAVARLGPDLLGADWDPELAVANLAADPRRPIGVALLDQRCLAGVGNVYRSEVCFLRAVHPATPVGDVDLPALVATCHRLLDANKLRTVRVTTGSTRRGQELFVYGRDRRPCRRCGTAVVREYLGGTESDATPHRRSVYFCPTCQR